MVELDAQDAALAHRNRKIESFVLGTKVVKISKRLASKVANLRVVALLLKFVDNNDWNDDFLFFELEQSLGV